MTLYRHSINHCLNTAGGLSQNELDGLLAQLTPALGELKGGSYDGAGPIIDIVSRTADIEGINQLAADIKKRFRHVVVAGAGGAGLSGRILAMLKPSYSHSLHFLDNIDPDALDDCLARIEVKDSCFLIISKSGSTVETLSQYYLLLDMVKTRLGKDAPLKHFIVITMPGDSPLRESAEQNGVKILDHESDIGGRFSALTNVGLLPAAIAGIDIAALRRGAQSVVNELKKAAAPKDCAPALGAAVQFGLIGKGRNLSVMLPYCERLAGFSSWYRQNWAESLGKSGKGSTPIRALGATDQHSQLQLYLDGPADKLFHLILLTRAGTGQKIPVPDRADVAYLKGKTTGDVMGAEQKATLETLVAKGCPVRLFELDQLGEEEMGALLMHFMLEIMFMARLLDVNPFDQPAVEDGKVLARDYLLTGNL